MQKTAAAYIRVSTDEQTELSPDSQLKHILAYAKNHSFLVPDRLIFVDEGISGKHTKNRTAFNRMIALAKTKPRPFDAILLWKFSRFARNREDSIVYKSMLRKELNIDVISVTEQLGDDKLSILIEALIEAMDEYYSINLAEEVKRGMQEKVSRGAPVSMPPLGYRMQNGQYVIDEKNAEVVRLVFHQFVNGHGCREIAKQLNAMGLRTARGNPFAGRAVAYLLHNPVYLGKIHWNPQGSSGRRELYAASMIVDGQHPPIIEQPLWEEAQRLLQKNQQRYGRRSRQKQPSEFWLQGLVRCSNCGAILCRSGKNSLQCPKYAAGQCGESHSISIPKLNAIVLRLLDCVLGEKTFSIPSPRKQDLQEKTDILQHQLDTLQRGLSRAKDAYTSGVDTLAEYRENKASLLSAIASLQEQLSHTHQNEVVQSGSHQVQIVPWLQDPNISAEVKNKFLCSMIDKIILDRKANRLRVIFSH
ncbi:MAG: recombinase family protein [Oscillospiraceae bacterium]|nr:recombinase family protein [Oscillospiraceae bacterium]